ncbi:hypothetical protein [Dactylosporangium sp. CA-233914]
MTATAQRGAGEGLTGTSWLVPGRTPISAQHILIAAGPAPHTAADAR